MSIGIHASSIYCPFVISERNFIDFTSSGLSNACGAVPIAFTAGSSQSVLVQKPTFENCSAGHRSGVLHQHRAMTLVQTTNYRFPAFFTFNVDYYAVTDCCTTYAGTISLANVTSSTVKSNVCSGNPTGLDDGGTGFGLTNGTDLNVTNTNVIKM
ncbi:hypothetical protein BLNAU_22944 [Blattamonas nauphoetae]|uniref:Uncharacterized protein n=1 Tax=Blattamonas nauphoetae TaxID=2049346 RepID=A0ABQ9WS37_9EUKA|nr:hypothetical protein BLNAU_22944 [Blattamonas nauphoetae]